MTTFDSVRETPLELRVSSQGIAAGLIAAGTLLAMTAEFGQAEIASAVVGLLAILLGAATWAAADSNRALADWLLPLGLQALVVLSAVWLRNPLALGLLALPPALMAASGRPWHAIGLGLLESALLRPGLGVLGVDLNPYNVVAGLLAVWSMPLLVWATGKRVRDLAGWLAGYYEATRVVVRDARQREAASQSLREEYGNALRQLAIANERLAALRMAADEARESKSAFVAAVSHEFRTPLNIIIGMVSLMVEAPEVYEGEFPAHAMEQLRVVYENCQHLASMIEDVLDLSRVEAGHMALHREPVDVVEVIGSAVQAVRPLVTEKRLRLEVQLAEGLPEVHCDRTRVRQIVLNLLSNAARLTDKGSIMVRLTQRNGYMRLEVGDTGPGIAPEDSERIFEPFQRGSVSMWRDRRGTGLGLSLSRTFVQLHGGRMWFESELGKGTTFFIELPLSPLDGHPSRPDRWIRQDWVWRERSFRTEAVSMEGVTGGLRVLVVDPSGGLMPELARYADDVQFTSAQDLPSAAQELRACPAHAAIVNAPSAESIQAVVEQARTALPQTPLIGCFCPPRAARSWAAGAKDYLVKPVLWRDLARAISAVQEPVRRLLVVDDEAEARDLLASYARALDPTLEVTSVGGGEAALAAMRTVRPDLVLLDVLMPDMSGWDVLAQKGREEAIQAIPVVMVSAQDAREKPPSTPVLVATQGDGLSIAKLLACSHHLSSMLLRPD